MALPARPPAPAYPTTPPQFHRRFARLVLLPAYIARYVYGTRYKAGTSGVILPQVFVAAVGGTRDGGSCNWGGGRHCPACYYYQLALILMLVHCNVSDYMHEDFPALCPP